MKKIILTFLLIFSFAYSKAQESFLFHLKYIPDHLYELAISTDMNMEINFSGDSAIIENMKESGMKSPMVMASKKTMNVDITTGAIKTDNYFPISIYYKDIISKNVVNGAESATPQNPLEGKKILGRYSTDGKMQIDSILGTQINNELKNTVAKLIDNMINQLHFPDKPIKIGETFTQQLPFSLPVAGTSIDAIINIVYKLKSVESGIAIFDLDESMTMDITTDKNGKTLTLKGAGAGAGTMTYDIKGNYSPFRTANLKMTYTMQIGKLSMAASANIASTTQTKLSANN
jgi:hypothetical protein